MAVEKAKSLNSRRIRIDDQVAQLSQGFDEDFE